MTIDVSVTANSNIAPAPFPRDLYEEQLRDIDRFEIAIEQYLAGEITEDVFRVMRLNNGIYGQRQGGTNQMVRIKLPAGSIRPDQLELMAELATDFSRGWGHITTRQNIQFHFVELRRIPDLLRKLAAVGLTSREACGDTVRNVMADLEELGMLEKPHTSAGRIPTDQGFRFYVDRLVKLRDPAPKERELIEQGITVENADLTTSLFAGNIAVLDGNVPA